MIILHASIAIKAQARDRWLELVKAVTPPSRAEDACQSYNLYESVEDSNAFIFVEEWASLDGLHAHFHSPHFGAFMAGLGEVLAGPPTGTVTEAGARTTLEDVMSSAGVGG